MVFSKATQEFLSGKETPPTPPKEKGYKSAKIEFSIEEKRAELEKLKIDKEIERLSKPDIPENNYFSQMLQQQQEHFKQLLEMSAKQNDLKLEIEKLKLMGGDNEDSMLPYLQMFAPLIPKLLEKKAVAPPAPAPAPMEMKGGENVNNEMAKIETVADLEEYKKLIKSGEITEEQAYADFLESIPNAEKILTREQFKIHFEKVKNGN